MTVKELNNIYRKMQFHVNVGDEPEKIDHKRIVVGMATCGIASGATPVFNAIKEALEKQNITDVELKPTGCIGLCQYEPIVEVFEPGKDKVTYIKMDEKKATEVVEKHVGEGKIITEYTVASRRI